MTPEKEQKKIDPEPRGFGEHTRGLSGEYAHEQGWGLDVEERTRGPKNPDGGTDYEYGARDFGDEAVNVAGESTILRRTMMEERRTK
ncbi:MAG: hypothetical protein ABI197_12125 [Granulicella sp.]